VLLFSISLIADGLAHEYYYDGTSVNALHNEDICTVVICKCCFGIFQVTGREIFQVLKEKHGAGFDKFIKEKICPLVGDIMYENFGLDTAKLTKLSKEIEIIVNGAANTKFSERFEMFPGHRCLT
jgi:hypothetical protein